MVGDQVKTEDLMILGVAGLMAWFILGRGAARSAPAANDADYVEEIFNGVAGWANGWRYFENGTAIDPLGNYYHNGQLVYRAQS